MEPLRSARSTRPPGIEYDSFIPSCTPPTGLLLSLSVSSEVRESHEIGAGSMAQAAAIKDGRRQHSG